MVVSFVGCVGDGHPAVALLSGVLLCECMFYVYGVQVEGRDRQGEREAAVLLLMETGWQLGFMGQAGSPWVSLSHSCICP